MRGWPPWRRAASTGARWWAPWPTCARRRMRRPCRAAWPSPIPVPSPAATKSGRTLLSPASNRWAYVANGSAGVWIDHPGRTEIPNRLAREGHVFHAVSPRPIGQYPVLEDGRSVHISDVMAHLVEDALKRTGRPENAIATAMMEIPSEVVGLFISPQHSDAVYGARWNMPACVGMDDDGAYVASSPEGFPPTVRWWRWIPPCSSFTMSKDRLCMSPMGPASEAIVDDVDRGKACEAILDALSRGEALHVGALLKAVEPLCFTPAPNVRYDPVYDVLYALMRSGQIYREVKRVPGAAEGIDGVRFLHRLKE